VPDPPPLLEGCTPAGPGVAYRLVEVLKEDFPLISSERRIIYNGQTNSCSEEKTSEIGLRGGRHQKISDPRCRARARCLGEKFGEAGARFCRRRSEAKISKNKNNEVEVIIPPASAIPVQLAAKTP
jgi:hypothetical protein